MALVGDSVVNRFPQYSEGAKAPTDKEGKAVNKGHALLMDLKGKQGEASRARSAKESQWKKNLMQYRGQDTEEFRQSEHTKVSLRTTTVKVKAAVAQIIEAMLGNGQFPLTISETENPEGVMEYAHIEPDMPQPEQPQERQERPYVSSIGFEGDGMELERGMTFEMLNQKFRNIPEESTEALVKEGAGYEGEPTVAPAKEAAKRMEKAIHDQLESSQAQAHLDSAVFEAVVMGTGAFKGPFNEVIQVPYWEKAEDGTRVYAPKEKVRPKVEFVSIWDLYIDPACGEDIRDAEWVIQRHKMNMMDLRKLKRRPLFDKQAIDSLLTAGPNYEDRDKDTDTEDPQINASTSRTSSLFEVWEYWGYVSKDKLVEFGIKVPDYIDDDFVQVNVWYSGDYILRVSLNPFEPNRIPYYVFPYERDPYSIYGTGIPEAMADQQKLINGFMRMAVDNLALAGNLVFDVDETMLAPGQDMEIEPGKIFRRVAGAPGQAVYGIKFPSTANENLQMVREARQYADESTGIPSLAHGQTGVSGYGRTSSGMSMILNNASLNIKSAVRHIDKHLVVPLGQAMFAWNMQFNAQNHPEISGDVEVKATGASNLEQKDVEAQRLQTFLQLSMNPALAPLIRLPNVVKRLAQTMDMDPEDILNTPEEAAFYATLMGAQGMQQGQGGPQPTGMGPGQGNFQGGGEGNAMGENGNVPGVNAPNMGPMGGA